MIEGYENLFFQGGMVAIFVVFTILLVTQFVKFINKQQDNFTKFLEAERQQRREIMETSSVMFASSLTEVVKSIEKLNDKLDREIGRQ